LSWLLAAPFLLPLLAAAGCFLAPSPAVRAGLGLAASLLLLAVALVLLATVLEAGVVAGQAGGWPAPFGITLVADRLSAAMVLVTAVVAVAVVVYARAEIDPERERLGFHGFLQVLIAGVCGAFVTGDLFNLYVWFEVMLIASFALMVLGNERAQLDGAIKYVALNLVSTVLFLTAVGLLYGLTGTLNMADLHRTLAGLEDDGRIAAVALLLLVGFGIKSAVFPLFFWLPASYHTPPVTVSALFAGLLTKVGVYAMIRIFTLVFPPGSGPAHEVLLPVAGLTMLTGVLGAAAQGEIRRILSFHIVSQIGYMVLGLALATPLALAGAVFYILHHILVKANLFLVGGAVQRLAGGSELRAIGGLWRARPGLALLFLVPAFSLAGFPPLSGFWAKLLLIKASLDVGAWTLAGVALVTGLLTVYSMSKIWGEAFWKEHPAGLPRVELAPGERALLLGPVAGLALLTVAIGLFPAPLLAFALAAAAQLLDPAAYVLAVLGPAGGGG
jgi:multicomponent Na+:H+ antiporter subunit D